MKQTTIRLRSRSSAHPAGVVLLAFAVLTLACSAVSAGAALTAPPDIGGHSFMHHCTRAAIPDKGIDLRALAFAPRVAYATGKWPSSVAVGDLNKDGKLDLVTANQYVSTVSVLLGKGGGSFKAKVDYATGSHPVAVAMADLNQDGKLDLVTADNYGGSVSVLLGRGDGTFKPKVTHTTGGYPLSVTVGDLNRDGTPDLVVPGCVANKVSVLLGKGGGSFKAKVSYATGTEPSAVAVGDLNKDGAPDLAVANGGANSVSVLLGRGDGTFKARVDYATATGVGPPPNGPFSVAVGDFNKDGKPDLAAAVANSVSVLLGKGDGTFKASVAYATGKGPESVAVGDLNKDGKLDLVTADGADGANSVSVLLGRGDGTFKARVSYAAGSCPASVAVADLNKDGKLDLAVADFLANRVSVLLNKSN